MNPLMLQPGRAPGRATPGDAPATPAPKSAPKTDSATTQSSEGAPATSAQDAAAPAGFLGGMGPMLILTLFMVGFIFLMGRNDKKKRAEIESKLKKGDRVITRAGIMGKVVEVNDGNARVEIAPGVVVKMLKTAIEGLADEDSAKSSAKKDTAKDADKDGKKKK